MNIFLTCYLHKITSQGMTLRHFRLYKILLCQHITDILIREPVLLGLYH